MTDGLLRFVIEAAYGQFYVQDLPAYDAWTGQGGATDPELPPAGWTHDAVHLHRIGVEPHSISVGTARIDFVESLITVHASAPMEEPTAEHIVEADLDVPGGELTISSPAVYDGPTLTVPAGLFRARVSYLPSTPPAVDIHDEAPGDHFLYRIDLRPAGRPRELVVLRQGIDPWAG